MDSKQYHQERYQWLKAHGLCVDCAKLPAVPGRVRCAECAEKNNAAVIFRRKKYISEKRCYICGKPAYTHSTLCIDCVLKRSEQARQSYIKRKAAQMI